MAKKSYKSKRQHSKKRHSKKRSLRRSHTKKSHGKRKGSRKARSWRRSHRQYIKKDRSTGRYYYLDTNKYLTPEETKKYEESANFEDDDEEDYILDELYPDLY
jgi:hypothetical protein